MFLLRKRFWLTVLKLFALAYVGGMIWLQVPQLSYALGPKRPLPINSPKELASLGLDRPAFVSIAGTPDFDHAFEYPRYGLTMTYFNVREYDMMLLVRTYDKVDDDWLKLEHLLGRLKPFDREHFARRIREIYREQFSIEVPQGAYLLALDDVPRLSGWQVGAVAVAGTAWVAMLYFFFLWRRRRPVSPGPSPRP